MKAFQILALLLALTLCLCLSACKKGEGDESMTEPPLPETAAPIDDAQKKDYTSNPERVAQLEALSDSFVSVSVSPEADFRVVEQNGGVRITDYLGTAAEVRIPETINGLDVLSIADAAFAEKTELKKLYIPDSVTSIGVGILRGCTALEALRIPMVGNGSGSAFLGYFFGVDNQYIDNARDVPASLAYLELGETITELADYALFDCNDLVYLSMPDTLKTLGTYSLYNCSSLIALDVSSLTMLGDYAMDSCKSLTRLEFGDGLISMGKGALHACNGLRRLTLPFAGGSASENTYLGYVFGAEVPDFSKGFYPQYLTEVTLTSSCTSLGNYAFFECESLERLHLNEGVTSFGVRAFAGCIRLRTLSLPDSLGVIRESAFVGCLSLSELIFQDTSKLESIGVNAFYSCEGLQKVVLPASLKALPASAFADCFSLSAIDLGGVESVGSHAFHRCYSLKSLQSLPNTIFVDGKPVME